MDDIRVRGPMTEKNKYPFKEHLNIFETYVVRFNIIILDRLKI